MDVRAAMRRAVASACLALLAAAAAAAAPPSGAAAAPLRISDAAPPSFSAYGPREGLADEIWSTVGLGPDGFVWAGSASTLSRFDGYAWQPMGPAGARSLVRDLASDGRGRLWAIFEREGLARLDARGWTVLGPARFHQRFSVLRGPAGEAELWVAHNGGVARLQGDEWVEDPGNDRVAGRRTIAIARSRDLFGAPREWLASFDAGVWVRDTTPVPGPWRPAGPPALAELGVTDLRVVRDGGRESLWIAAYGSGVWRWDERGLRRWSRAGGELPGDAVYSIVDTPGPAGGTDVWVASRGGLLRFRGDAVEVFDRRHGLPSDVVRGVKTWADAGGVSRLWVATEGGLARAVLTDNPWATVTLHGASENGIFGLMLEPDGRGGERLWVGSSVRGLQLLEDGRWRTLAPGENGLPRQPVRGLWRLPDGRGGFRRLVSLQGAPLMEIVDDLRLRPLPTPWPVTPDGVATTLHARTVDGAVEWWAGTSHAGLWRWRDGRWQSFAWPGLPRQPQANAFADQVDADGRRWLWVAESLGLARFDGVAWERLPADLGQPEGGFRAVAVLEDDGRQVLWAGSTHQGVMRFDVGDPRAPRRLGAEGLPPAPDPTIYSVLRDSVGRTYVCTNNGVQQLTRAPDGGWRERVFRRRDGLVHDECNSNGQFIDRYDRYWVGTLGGLAMYDPNAQPPSRETRPSPLRLTAVEVEGEPVALPAGEALELAPGQRRLRVAYTLLTGLREDESRYRSRLVGLEDEAGPWVARHSRDFDGLPPGDYVLHVQARDFAGTLAEPLELPVRVRPLWWQRPWLQALAALAFATLALGGVRAYLVGLRRRERQLQAQVAERTADLHSANRRLTELSYLDPLTGIANRRRLLEAMAASMQRAATLGKPVALLVADVDHFKDYNDRFGHLAGDAALRAIAQALDSAKRGQDLVARFGGEEFACLLPDADLRVVERVAERMRLLVEALPPRALGNDTHTLTISVGVVSRVPEAGQTPESLIALADRALYEAKAAGRNRVHRAG